jgi:hypothetical protein
MIEMTTSSSTSVKAPGRREETDEPCPTGSIEEVGRANPDDAVMNRW